MYNLKLNPPNISPDLCSSINQLIKFFCSFSVPFLIFSYHDANIAVYPLGCNFRAGYFGCGGAGALGLSRRGERERNNGRAARFLRTEAGG